MSLRQDNSTGTSSNEVNKRLEFESVRILDLTVKKSTSLAKFYSDSSISVVDSIPTSDSEDRDSDSDKRIGDCAALRYVELALHKKGISDGDSSFDCNPQTPTTVDPTTSDVSAFQNSEIAATSDRRTITPDVTITLNMKQTQMLNSGGEADNLADPDEVAYVLSAILTKVGTVVGNEGMTHYNPFKVAKATDDAASVPRKTETMQSGEVVHLFKDEKAPPQPAKRETEMVSDLSSALTTSPKQKEKRKRKKGQLHLHRDPSGYKAFSFGGVLPTTMGEVDSIESIALVQSSALQCTAHCVSYFFVAAIMKHNQEASNAKNWAVGDVAQALYEGSITQVELMESSELHDGDGVSQQCFFAKWPNKKDTQRSSNYALLPHQLRVPITNVIALPNFGKSRHARIKAITSAVDWKIGRRFTTVDGRVREIAVNDVQLKLVTDTENNVFSYLRIMSGSDNFALKSYRPTLKRHLKRLRSENHNGSKQHKVPRRQQSQSRDTKASIASLSMTGGNVSESKRKHSGASLASTASVASASTQSLDKVGAPSSGPTASVASASTQSLDKVGAPSSGPTASVASASTQSLDKVGAPSSGPTASVAAAANTSVGAGNDPGSANYVEKLINELLHRKYTSGMLYLCNAICSFFKPVFRHMKDESTDTTTLTLAGTSDVGAMTDPLTFTMDIPPTSTGMTLYMQLTRNGLESVLPLEELTYHAVAFARNALSNASPSLCDGTNDPFDDASNDGTPIEGDPFGSPVRQMSCEIQSSASGDPLLHYMRHLPPAFSTSGEALNEACVEEETDNAATQEDKEFVIDLDATKSKVQLTHRGETQTQIVRLGKSVLCTKPGSLELMAYPKYECDGDLELQKQIRPKSDIHLELQKQKRPKSDIHRATWKRKHDASAGGTGVKMGRYSSVDTSLPPTPTMVGLLKKNADEEQGDFELTPQSPAVIPKSTTKKARHSNVDQDGLTTDWTAINEEQPFMFMRHKTDCNMLMVNFRKDVVHVTLNARTAASSVLQTIDTSAVCDTMTDEDLKDVVNKLTKAARSFMHAIYGIKSNRVVLMQFNPKTMKCNVTPSHLISQQPPPLKQALEFIQINCGFEKAAGEEKFLNMLNVVISRMQGCYRAAKRRVNRST